jgi:hypothetical protein
MPRCTPASPPMRSVCHAHRKWIACEALRTSAARLAVCAMVSPTANTLHLIGAVAAFFFLPLGYLVASLLGMRRAPVLATVCVALSLIGWIPWAALIVLDDLAVAINQTGSTPRLDALWAHVNGDPSCPPSC